MDTSKINKNEDAESLAAEGKRSYWGDETHAPDYSKALEYFERAAELGSAEAQYNLGIFYRDGIGLEKSLEKAMHWLEQCAQQDFPAAQAELSVCLMNEDNPEQSNIQAMKWALLAKKNNEPRAEKIIEILENHMTREEIAEAQKLTKSLIH